MLGEPAQGSPHSHGLSFEQFLCLPCSGRDDDELDPRAKCIRFGGQVPPEGGDGTCLVRRADRSVVRVVGCRRPVAGDTWPWGFLTPYAAVAVVVVIGCHGVLTALQRMIIVVAVVRRGVAASVSLPALLRSWSVAG
ncbi:hypothetical protein Rhe02_37460 [Rhizocola hellebori]|uniref:Uncharacterized protein n=1 Tax=Rhizocola hellebori TaxID=1392758 RepID=A0A8J3VFU2_9ACTN|nr:hypothetical protein Rhe02_37460 [Rhizocola hellebori]